MFRIFQRNRAEQEQDAAKIQQAVAPTKRSLFSRIGQILQGGDITEELWDNLEEALIAADVGVETTDAIMREIRRRVAEKFFPTAADARSFLREEMLRILTVPDKPLSRPAPGSPWVVLVVGVNGSGKTTTIGKLAALYGSEGKSVVLGAADTFRAAAIDQLKLWGERAGAAVIAHQPGADPGAVAFDSLQAATRRAADVIIIDTAGRLQTKVNLMEELKKIRRVVQRGDETAPHEVLLVLDATTGQNGLSQARHFTEAVQVTGVVLAKLDGTAKGGVALAICDTLHLPLLYVGTGEKMDDLAPFDAGAFVDALLS